MNEWIGCHWIGHLEILGMLSGFSLSHDTSAPVTRIKSSGFSVVAMPSTDGISNVEIPSAIPPAKSTRFFITVTSTWNDQGGRLMILQLGFSWLLNRLNWPVENIDEICQLFVYFWVHFSQLRCFSICFEVLWPSNRFQKSTLSLCLRPKISAMIRQFQTR